MTSTACCPLQLLIPGSGGMLAGDMRGDMLLCRGKGRAGHLSPDFAVFLDARGGGWEEDFSVTTSYIN